jgi:hypothetical protein
LSDYQPIFSDEQIRAAAAAIANARGARRGVPHVINILELLPPKLLDEVMEDAKVALEAGARFSVRDVQLRPSTEIQIAHDVLWHVVMEKTPLQLDAAELLLARAGLDVLCWVLLHDHNPSFAANLHMLRHEMSEAGMVLSKLPPAEGGG